MHWFFSIAQFELEHIFADNPDFENRPRLKGDETKDQFNQGILDIPSLTNKLAITDNLRDTTCSKKVS